MRTVYCYLLYSLATTSAVALVIHPIKLLVLNFLGISVFLCAQVCENQLVLGPESICTGCLEIHKKKIQKGSLFYDF